MLASILLSNNPLIFWFGTALLTTTVVPLVTEIMGVHYLSNKVRTILLCIGITSMILLTTFLILIVTQQQT